MPYPGIAPSPPHNAAVFLFHGKKLFLAARVNAARKEGMDGNGEWPGRIEEAGTELWREADMTMELREEARRRELEMAALAERRERFAGDLRKLAASPEGRRFFQWLIDQGNLFAEDYQPGPLGAYRAGAKAMSLRIWRLLAKHLSGADFAAIALEAGRGRSEAAVDGEDGMAGEAAAPEAEPVW